MDAERGRRVGPLQRRLEPHRTARAGACRPASAREGLPLAVQVVSRPGAGGTAAGARRAARGRAALGGSGAARLRVSDEQALLGLAVEAARLGGRLLAERAAQGAEASVSSKSTPTDLVSEADLASQRAIHELLAAERPEDGFLGEEEGASVPGQSGLRWIVDPLDGTVNFLFGIPQWCGQRRGRGRAGDDRGGGLRPEPRGAVHSPRAAARALLEADGARRELRGRGEDPQGGEGADGLASAMVATGLAYDARVRARQAQALATADPARARHPALRQRGARSLLDRGRPLRRLLRALGQAVGRGGGRARVRARRAGGARAAGGGGPALGPARGAARGSRSSCTRSSAARERCGGWDSNPHALADRAF